MFGEHGLIDKRVAYETSIRVPMLMQCPDLLEGGTVVVVELIGAVAPLDEGVRQGVRLARSRVDPVNGDRDGRAEAVALKLAASRRPMFIRAR